MVTTKRAAVIGNGETFDPLKTLERLDHAKLVEEIAAMERKRDEAIAEIQRNIDALKVLERAAYIRDHGKPPRKLPGPRKKKEIHAGSPASPEGTVKDRILRYLAVNPAKTATIAADLGIPMGSVSATMSSLHASEEVRRNLDGMWNLRRSPRDE